MQWWCSAQHGAWEWTWRPYVGVWLLIAAIAVGYWAMRRRFDGDVTDRRRRREVAAFSMGLCLLWVALDWPLGPLGASYLASVHMLQFLLIGLIAPALLLLGIPRPAFERLRAFPSLYGFLEGVTQPLAAFFIFNVGVTVAHWPSLVDAAMTTQLGMFAMDMSWVVLGVVLWWPVLCPVPAWPKFHPLFKIGYLAINGIIIRPPMMILLFSEFPAYATYELAPPIAGVSALGDQQFAGGVMKVGSAWIMMVAILLLFMAWRRGSEPGVSPPLHTPPGAGG